MNRIMGLFLLTFLGCSGGPVQKYDNYVGYSGSYRPAFFVGDQVSVTGGEYAQLVGTVVEIDMDLNVYRVRLAGNPNPVFIKANLLRKYTGAQPVPDSAWTPPDIEKPAIIPAAAPASGLIPAFPPADTQPTVAGGGPIGRLAVLPVIGIDEYVAETVAWHLANEVIINSSFNVVPITPQIRKNVVSEESYNAIYNAGEDVRADYIMASFARRVGCENIFMMVVLDTKTKEQLAGDYRKYIDVQDIPSYFPSMAKKIMNVIKSKMKGAPRLSVELMATPPESSFKNDSAILTQLFAIAMANTNTYSIFPRTSNIDAAMLDYEMRRTSARKVYINKDDITATEFVLSSKIESFNSQNEVLAEIVDIANNVLKRGAFVRFDIVEDVPELLGRLSANLTVNKNG